MWLPGPDFYDLPRRQRLKAPCWWCSKKLQGGHGWLAPVDGNEVAFHAMCLREALWDENFRGRIKAPVGFDPGAVWLFGGVEVAYPC